MANQTGERIRVENGKLIVPDHPVIPFIEGDGIGPDIWKSASKVLNAAVDKAYQGKRGIQWFEIYAGEKAYKQFNSWLPDETLAALRTYLVGIKGPLTTPVGEGIRSINVALRKDLDLYACVRPVRYFKGAPTPVKHPERVDMVTFRENTEDIYTGIEFMAGTPELQHFLQMFKEQFPKDFAKIRFPETSSIGLKPISQEGSTRLIRAAIRYALQNHRRSVTLVHKGNIMKFTEGAFRNWGYALAEAEFGDRTYTRAQWERTRKTLGEEAANQEEAAAIKSGKLLIKDIIADIVFEQTITMPETFDVLATTNLNGDFISDALPAQVGGVGIAPGANINYEVGTAIFEATHGTAPTLANKNQANPCSLILSGEMLLRYLGWAEAADLVIKGLESAIGSKHVTGDFYRQMDGATLLGTAEFGDEIIKGMDV